MHDDPSIRPPPAPVRESARLGAVDTLRGVAVLGILAMNIVAYALPGAAYLNPLAESLVPYAGPFTGANYAVWLVCHIVFDQKMMAIFSMLFGAGLVLMNDRIAAREPGTPRRAARFAGLYYRRLMWLLLIGMLHAYLLWYGDILVAYALCGLLLYTFRGVRPWILITIGVLVVLVAVPINVLMGLGLGHVQHIADDARAAEAAGRAITSQQQQMIQSLSGWENGANPDTAAVHAEVAALRGSYLDVLRHNAMSSLFMQTFIMAIFTFWRCCGLMLIGMGLMRLGVLSASRSNRFYVTLAAAGYLAGLPLTILSIIITLRSPGDPMWTMAAVWPLSGIGGIGVALGHVGVVMLICRAGVLPGVMGRLAAVGRMAFTNYLTQSLICCLIFYGWGLGYFGSVERAPLMLIVVGIWILQLLWSPWWLARFRFGPFEWLWRSLTYLTLQPMLRSPVPRVSN
ncbi:MAG: DUF418 domain-containing protein [Phycisphaeraceae bacterium]|nr:DUF418 domain-containing protein [Phycisphaeraceae bacterium]